MTATIDYSDLASAITAGESSILILDGVHEVQDTVVIDRPHVSIRGQSRLGTILRKVGPASFILVVNTSNVTVSHLTLDAQTHDSDKSPTWEAFGCVNCNHSTLSDTVIFSSNNMFAVFFAGSANQFDAGQATIDAFDAGFLDDGIAVDDNVIYSIFPGDVLSFLLQKNGRVANNRIVRGLVAFFMNKDSSCSFNAVSKSASAGIFVSVPAENNLIEGNGVFDSKASGIVVRRQIGHRDEAGAIVTPALYHAPGMTVLNNEIFNSRFMGIGIVQTIGAVVEDNKIINPDCSAIYTLQSDNDLVVRNTAEDFGQCLHRETIHQRDSHHNSGVYCDFSTTNAVVKSNLIVNATSDGARFGVTISLGRECGKPGGQQYGGRKILVRGI